MAALKQDKARAQAWARYFRDVVREWKYADAEGDRVFLGYTDIGIMLGVTSEAIRKWWLARAVPRPELCKAVALAFDLPYSDVALHAGYTLEEIDGNTSINELRAAVSKDARLSGQERVELLTGLALAESASWRAEHPDIAMLIRSALDNKMAGAIAKAARVVSIVKIPEWESAQNFHDSAS